MIIRLVMSTLNNALFRRIFEYARQYNDFKVDFSFKICL